MIFSGLMYKVEPLQKEVADSAVCILPTNSVEKPIIGEISLADPS